MRLSAKIALASIALSMGGTIGAQERPAGATAVPLTAHEVAVRMEAKGRERALALHELEASRVYHLEYRGFGGNKEAEMKVRMSFHAPATKTFTVISQEGSNFIIERVFHKLLESEQEALEDQNRQATALTLDNYEFALAGYQEHPDGTHTYVLDVKPRSKNKFLYEGRIWVNGEDFAVTRIEAVPVRSPSFWIKKTQIEHVYIKVGNFWLPAENRSESQIRLGGRALLTIDYDDYRVNATPAEQSDAGAMVSTAGSQRAKKTARNRRSRQFGASDAALADAVNIPK
ncbi:MAG TPA: hypothetical protein VKW06_08095 [Candidatus Angelobacter sp.]|nr:hypothetical protein [Candidatus Angelobacter sp.]